MTKCPQCNAELSPGPIQTTDGLGNTQLYQRSTAPTLGPFDTADELIAALHAPAVALEPVAPIAREPDMRRECSCVEVCYQKQGEVLGKNWKCRVEAERALYDARAAAPQAPAEPVAQEPVAWMLDCPNADVRRRVLLYNPAAIHQGHQGDTITPLYASPISLPVEGSKVTRG